VHNVCRLTNLEENLGHTPYGPPLDNEAAIGAGQSLEDLATGGRNEAERIAREISGGLKPIEHANQFHFHPVWPDGTKMPNHIFWPGG
jgi:hypothetical protein